MQESPGRRLREAVDRIAELTRDRSPRGVSHDDELDDVGTIASDDAIGFDPLPVLRGLSDSGASAVVMGQVAGILHGSTEPTGDLDLLWSGEPADAGSMADAFVSLLAQLFDDDRTPVTLGADAFALPKVLFRTASASGDCCTPRLPWAGLDVRAFIERAEETDVGGVRVRYLAVDDLVAMRRLSLRPKDVRRIAELERLFPRLGCT